MKKKTTISDSLVSGSKAISMLDLSRHSFGKIVESGAITPQIVSGKKYYKVDQLEAFMKTDTYNDLLQGVVDPRNTLNDLTGKDWLPETKSFFYQKGLGANSSEAQIEKLHPAPYSFQDIGHLVRFFTKQGMRVLDPFGGVGSTAKACEVNGRICTSIELSERWHKLSIQRLETEVGAGTSTHHNDLFETRAVKLALGDAAKDVVINSTKSMIGHLLGAAGAVECIVTVKSIQDGFIHQTVGTKECDEECDLNYAVGAPVEKEIKCALTNSLGFGGHNATLLLKKYEG